MVARLFYFIHMIFRKIIMSLCLILFYNTSTKVQFSGPGSGTKNSPYLISTPEQLDEIRNDLSAYYCLKADIDLEQWISANMGANGWIPIGTEGVPFSGTIEGQGHTINNLKINRSTNVGFLGATNNATIQNFIIKSADINGIENVGCLIGLMKNSNVNNIKLYGKCRGSKNVGGLIGNIIHTPIKSIDSTFHYNISKCISDIDIIGSENVGGLVGSILEDTYCYIPSYGGTKTKSGKYNTHYTMSSNVIQRIANSNFIGRLEGQKNIGGLIGNVSVYAEAYSDNGFGGNYSFYHTSIANSIVSVDSCFVNSSYTIEGNENVGGIVGYSNGNQKKSIGGYTKYNFAVAKAYLSIKNCSNATNIKAKENNIGGLLGNSECPEIDINASCFMGNISAKNNIGGICGAATGSSENTNTITNCYSNGKLNGKSYVGGIVGNATKWTVSCCYNSGNIHNEGDYTGGIVGKFTTGSISDNVVISENIYGNKYIGRIVGSVDGISQNNYANVLCKVFSKGYLLDINDDEFNGYAVGASSLKNASFYKGLQWNFENLWTNNNTPPYFRYQSSPVQILNVVTSNGYYINGTCSENGILYYRNANEDVLFKNIENNNWDLSLTPTTHICLYEVAKNKQPSMLVCTDIAIKPSSLTLDEHNILLHIGESHKLTYSLLPLNSTSDLVWTSSNPNVAIVNTNGEVTAIAGGETVITVETSDKKISDKCQIKVVIPVESIMLSTNNLEIEKGESFVLMASILPSNASDKNIKWISTNPNIVYVDKNGKITAIDYGETSVVVQTEDGDKMDICKIKVIKHVSSISLNKTELNMKIGERYKLSAIIEPSDATNKNILWNSSDTSVASIDNMGVVTAQKYGIAIIMAKSEDSSQTAICVINVNNTSGVEHVNNDIKTWEYIRPEKKIYLKNCSTKDIICLYSTNGKLIFKKKCKTGINIIDLNNVPEKIIVFALNNQVCKILM